MTRNRPRSAATRRLPKKPARVSPKANIPGATASPHWSKFNWWPAALAVVALVIIGGVTLHLFRATSHGTLVDAPQTAPATFVGSQECAGCHGTEATLWQNSQHKLAMQHATEQTVLGDFNDARFDYYGVASRFFRKDGRFFVETDGPDGKLATFEVKYTFGVDPLQQYLIAFPDGRLQALSIAWDSRPKDKGGQRWFHLYPNEEIRHDDVLHWTKLNQNWNFMCAECHSTGVRKNYDAASDRFATTWAEINVGCEACHGQGSRHVAWARERQSWWPFGKTEDPDKGLLVRFDERRERRLAGRSEDREPMHAFTPPALRKEVETCGLCHARREHVLRGLGSGPMALGHASGRAAQPWALSRRWADARRGLQLRLVQAEQDVRGGRHLQRLP